MNNRHVECVKNTLSQLDVIDEAIKMVKDETVFKEVRWAAGNAYQKSLHLRPALWELLSALAEEGCKVEM